MNETPTKVTLTYCLPEHEVEFRDAIDGSKYRAALLEVGNLLRTMYKYGHQHSTPDDLLAEIRHAYCDATEKLNLE
jgi:hypothetical protein